MAIARQDFAFPFRVDAASQQTAQTSYPCHVDQMVRQLLLTSPGERVNLPQFGCGLRSLVFAPNSDALVATVKLRVIQGSEPVAGRCGQRGGRRPFRGHERGGPGTRHAPGHGHLHPRRDTDEPGRDGGRRMTAPPPAPDRRQLLLDARCAIQRHRLGRRRGEPDPALRALPQRGAGPGASGRDLPGDDHRRRGHHHDRGRPGRRLGRLGRLEHGQRGPSGPDGQRGRAGGFLDLPAHRPEPKLDPFFDSAPFSFKANCPTTLDCATPAPSCPEPTAEQVPIDYLAKDFGSFRQALSEFSALRYPAWVERSEADIGVMLMEALAAMADELSYYQDRVSAESTIETATQRLSVVRHARLVDYEPAPRDHRHHRAPARRAATRAPGAGPSTSRCSAAHWEATAPSSSSRSRTRHRASPARAASRSTPAGTAARLRRTTGTTASAACWPARRSSTSPAMTSGSPQASCCCSTHRGPTAPILRSVSWSRSPP